MGRKLSAEQAEAELPRNSKKEKKSKKDKKRKLAAEAEAVAAVEEVAKSSKKNKRAEDGPGGGGGEAENGADKAVAVTGKGSEDSKYAPLRSFSAAELPSQVLDCCKEFARPSPIQAHAWPFLLDGRDFIGIAATGSGTSKSFQFRLFSLVIPFRIRNEIVALRHSGAREDDCLWCAGAYAYQEEENGEEGCAAVPRAVADERARSAGNL
jgi:hypothetical protein